MCLLQTFAGFGNRAEKQTIRERSEYRWNSEVLLNLLTVIILTENITIQHF